MNNIRVGNLGASVTEEQIRSIFVGHGAVERFKMMTDREGLLRGIAFVEMTNDAEAEKAIAALNGTKFGGKAIQVSQARPQVHRSARPRKDRDNRVS